MELNHKSLCQLALKWLQRPHSQNGPGCTIVLSETACALTGETPDAIGWRPYKYSFCSVLVEVKVSLADFNADKAKPFRAEPSLGMGKYRYYMAPEGIVPHDKLPDGWGLIEVNKRGHIKIVRGHVTLKYGQDDPWQHPSNVGAENSLLCLTLARVADPQRTQEMIRAANNRASLLDRNLEKERERNNRLAAQNMRLRNEMDEMIMAAEGKTLALKPLERRPEHLAPKATITSPSIRETS
jgi:hypothetical protein